MKRTPLLRKTPLKNKAPLQGKKPRYQKCGRYKDPQGASIMQTIKECYLTGRVDNLQQHHIFPGRRRKASDKWGCWVWLTGDAHTGHDGVHSNPDKLRQLQEACRERFVELYGEAKFIEVFGH